MHVAHRYHFGCKGSELFWIEQIKIAFGDYFSGIESIESPNTIRGNEHREENSRQDNPSTKPMAVANINNST